MHRRQVSLIILKFLLENPGELYTPIRLTKELMDRNSVSIPHSTVYENLQNLEAAGFAVCEAEGYKLKNTIVKNCHDYWLKERAKYFN